MHCSKLLRTTGIQAKLSQVGEQTYDCISADLVEQQHQQMLMGERVCRIPVMWQALAETVGLVVDADGRIIDGPHAEVCGVFAPAVTFAA